MDRAENKDKRVGNYYERVKYRDNRVGLGKSKKGTFPGQNFLKNRVKIRGDFVVFSNF